ncbi:MAG: amidohydrolase [Chthonomonadaceae bacterium]|nr:amidohydrolase [Chthonomonadaceae bacterium]
MTHSLSELITSLAPDAIAVRHHLHAHPELSNEEEQTSKFVAERLTALGVDTLRTGVGGHGVVAEIRGNQIQTGQTLALRADMDALPIQELSSLPYCSTKPGVMHACGHDGHTATLLGTAAALTQLRGEFTGTVRLIFQPAEEGVQGATRMCLAGVMDGVDRVVALHGWPGLAIGKIGTKPGAMMASSDTFDLVIRGKGAHAAQPHNSVDPIVIAAHLVTALQTISSREVSPTEAVVVTIAQIHAGTAYNVIPTEAVLKGTVRCLTNELREQIPVRIEAIAKNLCAAFRADCELTYRWGTKPTVNDESVNALIEQIGQEALGEGSVLRLLAPSMGAEDFAAYLDYAPGCMFRLGVGEEVTNLHTPTYNFSDGAVSVGMEMFTRIALKTLTSERAA